MVDNMRIFEVRQTGKTTIVGFGPDGVPSHFYYPECLSELIDLFESVRCEILAFHLTDVPCLASGFIELLATLSKRGIEVHLYNPVDYVRYSLESLQVNQLFKMLDVPTESLARKCVRTP